MCEVALYLSLNLLLKLDNTNIFLGFDLHVLGVKGGGGGTVENHNPSIMPRTSPINLTHFNLDRVYAYCYLEDMVKKTNKL